MEVVRQGKQKVRGSGYVVTWDVDSSNRSMANAVWMFIHGRSVRTDGREYTYPGFIERDGVRYLGQSDFFVLPHRLRELTQFLASKRVEYDVDIGFFP